MFLIPLGSKAERLREPEDTLPGPLLSSGQRPCVEQRPSPWDIWRIARGLSYPGYSQVLVSEARWKGRASGWKESVREGLAKNLPEKMLIHL